MMTPVRFLVKLLTAQSGKPKKDKTQHNESWRLHAHPGVMVWRTNGPGEIVCHSDPDDLGQYHD
jgi:hypothetical protein